MQNPRNLLVWNRALALATETYRLTARFPQVERFGLTSQMRRSAVSIGSNIAEGCGRRGDREYLAFLHIALGSLSELEFQLAVAANMECMEPKQLAQLTHQIDELRRMLTRLIVAVRARIPRKRDPG